MNYKTLYADPPWPENGGGKIQRGANRHYPTMKIRDILTFTVNEFYVRDLMADDAHGYIWVTNNYLTAGFEVLEAWGFRYITMITWPKPQIGIGQYFRGQTEHCLFGVRGRVPYQFLPSGKRAQGSTLLSPWSSSIHSQKPPEMRTVIERVSLAPRLELFAREIFPGWDSHGNQL